MILGAKTPPKTGTLIFLTALSTLSLNMFLPSLPNMATDLAVDYATVTLTVSGYLGITAIIMLFIGPLADRSGRRRILLFSTAIFSAASLVCALTDRSTIFLIARACQGIIISGWTLSMAAVRDMHPPKEAARIISYITMAMAIAPMLGPVMGGLIDTYFGWRGSFILYALLGVLAMCLVWVSFGETKTSHFEDDNAYASALWTLIRTPNFWGYAVCMAFSTGAFYVFLAGAPLVAKDTLGISTAELGIYLGSITGGFMFGSFLSSQFSAKTKLSSLMISGRLVAALGLAAGLSFVLSGSVGVLIFFGATIFVGIGNGLTMPSSNAGVMSVKPDLAGSASGLAGAMTIGGGAALTSLAGAIITPDNGALTVLAIMLGCTMTSLAAAVYVAKDRPKNDA